MLLAVIGCDRLASVPTRSLIQGRVVVVHDGDSITVKVDGRDQIKVRLEGIDAPELGQPQGMKAKVELSGIVMSRQVVLEDKGLDQYQRTLATVKVGDVNANLEMVRRGYAWHFTRYSSDSDLAEAETQARANTLGLWKDANPVPPWDWRRK